MNQPIVSILIRTCQRPLVLRQALESIRNQSYPNIEVVVVEDGLNTSEMILKKEFSDLNYVYEATNKKVGRCAAGNRAMELASGEYFNFLDDDDLLFPDHIQTLIETLVKDKRKAAYSIAEEHQIQIISKSPYQYKIKNKMVRFHQPFNRLLLYTFNYIPIQSIMFHRSLYEILGGLDENLDTLEDWDLWVRYSTKTDYIYVDKITSCYHTPAGRKKKQKRSDSLKNHLDMVHKKFQKYDVKISVEDINQEMSYIIKEYKTNVIIRYVRMFFRVAFFGEK